MTCLSTVAFSDYCSLSWVVDKLLIVLSNDSVALVPVPPPSLKPFCATFTTGLIFYSSNMGWEF